MTQSDATISRRRLGKLESIRGFAAFYVVLHHLVPVFLPHKWYRFPFVFGPEAVMVFFVLSGFVIQYSVSMNPLDLRAGNYFIKRVRRIYPIFLFAIVLAYLCEMVRLHTWMLPDWKLLAGNLTMMQGVQIKPFYDGPMWSLSYEWWFYCLYFAVIKLEGRPQYRQFWVGAMSLVGLISAVLFYNQASLFLMYFMVWWCGVELARQYLDEGTITWRRQATPVGMLTCISGLSLLLSMHALRQHEGLSFVAYPLLFFRHLSAAVLIICAGIAWAKRGFIGFDRLLGRFAILASTSYALYIVHYPIIFAVDSFDKGRFAIPKVAIVVGLSVILAYLLEIRLQPMINQWTKRFLTGRSRAAAQRSSGSIFGRQAA